MNIIIEKVTKLLKNFWSSRAIKAKTLVHTKRTKRRDIIERTRTESSAYQSNKLLLPLLNKERLQNVNLPYLFKNNLGFRVVSCFKKLSKTHSNMYILKLWIVTLSITLLMFQILLCLIFCVDVYTQFSRSVHCYI